MQRIHLLAVALVLVIAACGDDDDAAAGPGLTVASLNILNGLRCPPESFQCLLQDRVDLFFRWVATAGCPDVDHKGMQADVNCR